MKISDPIVIAGFGPSGAVLALSLAKAGVPTLLLEREPELPIDLRASTFHPPSLDMIQALDASVHQQLVDKGLIADRYQYRDRRTGEVATFDMSMLADETKNPFRLQLEQYELTYIIHEKLKAYDCVDIRFSHEVKSFSEHDGGVDVLVATPSGKQQFRGAFVVGAEGARSNVRKAANIDFQGFTYDEKFLVVSTDFAFEDVFDDFSYVNYVSDPEEWCVILRTDKLWRVLFPTTPEDLKDEERLLSDEFIQQRLHRLHNKDGDFNIGHRTLYGVNQRVANTYHQGRMVLMGDACHINNPLGGMGMNGGLHDAFNLAERLIRLANTGGDYTAEFEHYDRQRKDLAVRFVQEHTINNKKLMESTDDDVQAKRQKMFMDTAADPIKAKAFLMERAMINCVRESFSAA